MVLSSSSAHNRCVYRQTAWRRCGTASIRGLRDAGTRAAVDFSACGQYAAAPTCLRPMRDAGTRAGPSLIYHCHLLQRGTNVGEPSCPLHLGGTNSQIVPPTHELSCHARRNTHRCSLYSLLHLLNHYHHHPSKKIHQVLLPKQNLVYFDDTTYIKYPSYSIIIISSI